MAEVILNDVRKVYPGGVEAVKGVNLEIADKEFVVLVGPSGCGKSTTLRMIAGLEEISSGTIRIGDRIVNDVPPKDRDIAMVFQNYALYPHMSVFDNMAFGLKLRNYPKAEIKARVDDAARILGIVDLLERKPKALSGGQRQRVAVGRAIVRKPAAFLFDEPLSNLDAKLRVEMRVELNRLHRRLATTMIYVTHDQIEAMTLGDRIVIMKLGVIQQIAAPMSLYDEPTNQFVASFIGTPPMNFLKGTLERTADALVFTDGNGIRVPMIDEYVRKLGDRVGKPVLLGIRPENIHLKKEDLRIGLGSELEARADVVESLGSEKIAYFSLGEHKFIGKLEGHLPLDVGSRNRLVLDAAKVHIFEYQDGRDDSFNRNLTCRVDPFESANLERLALELAAGS